MHVCHDVCFIIGLPIFEIVQTAFYQTWWWTSIFHCDQTNCSIYLSSNNKISKSHSTSHVLVYELSTNQTRPHACHKRVEDGLLRQNVTTNKTWIQGAGLELIIRNQKYSNSPYRLQQTWPSCFGSFAPLMQTQYCDLIVQVLKANMLKLKYTAANTTDEECDPNVQSRPIHTAIKTKDLLKTYVYTWKYSSTYILTL